MPSLERGSAAAAAAAAGRQAETEESATLRLPPATLTGSGPRNEFAAQRAGSTATTIIDPSELQTAAAPSALSSTEGRCEGGSDRCPPDATLGEPSDAHAAGVAAVVVRGKPAAAAATLARRRKARTPALSSRTCLAILQRLKAVGGLKNDEQFKAMAQQAKRAAGKSKKAEQDKAAPLLGAALAHASESLESEVRRLQGTVDEAQAAVEAGTRAQADADGRLQEALKAEVEGKVQLKGAEKAIADNGKAILGAMAGKQGAEAQVAAMQGRKRQLEETAEKVYRPLKEARVEGREAGKQISHLCKVGKKHGLHSELLSVAPAILRKQLDKRQTFDRLTVQSLDAEFTKHVQALTSKIQDGEQTSQEHSEALDAKRAAMLAARAQRKEWARKITQAAAAVRKSKEDAAAVRKRVKALPLALNKAKLQLEEAKGRVSKFRCGPLAAYTRVLPLPVVGEMEPQCGRS